MQKAPKPPAGIIMRIKTVALTFSNPKHSSSRISNYIQYGGLLAVAFSKSKAHVCDTRARMHTCMDAVGIGEVMPIGDLMTEVANRIAAV